VLSSPAVSALEAHLENEFQTILNFPTTLGSSGLTEAGVGGEAGDDAVSWQKACPTWTTRSIATRHLSA